MRKDEQLDELSKLLDSMEQDNALNERMNQFASQKKHHDDTLDIPVLQRGDLTQEESEVEKTRIAEPIKSSEVVTDQEATVVIHDDEIQSLLNETQAKSVKPLKPVKNTNQTAKYVLIGLAVLLVIFMLIGAFFLLNGSDEPSSKPTTEEKTHTSGYQKLHDWAKSYNELSSQEKKDIVNYSDIYDNLTKKEKATIDRLLEEATGSDFEVLLKSATKSKNKNNKNNDAAVAEKKAQIRSQISSLRDQLADAKVNLSGAQADLDAIQKQYDDTNKKIQELNTKIETQTATVDQDATKLNQLIDEGADQTDINQARLQYNNDYSILTSYQNQLAQNQANLNSIQTNLDNAKQVASQAQAQVDDYNAQIASLQKELSAL